MVGRQRLRLYCLRLRHGDYNYKILRAKRRYPTAERSGWRLPVGLSSQQAAVSMDNGAVRNGLISFGIALQRR